MSPWRRVLFAVLALGFASVLALGLLEVAVRVLAPQPPSWFAIYAKHPGVPGLYHHIPGLATWADTGETHYGVFTDERGHRIATPGARTPPPAQPDAPTVWFLGDSFTFGQGASYEASFVGRIDAAAKGRLVVDNAGVGGWGPVHSLADFDYELARGKAPDLVVLSSFLGNDYYDSIWAKQDVEVRDGILNDPGGLKSFLKRHTHTYRALANLYHRYVGTRDVRTETAREMARADDWQRTPLRDAESLYRDAMAGFARRARTHGIAFVVVLLPTREAVAEAAGAHTPGLDYELVHRRTRALLDGLGIEWIDVLPRLAKLGPEASYLDFDGHFRDAANAEVADAILEWIERRTKEGR